MHEFISEARKNLIKRYNIKFTSISISDEKDYYFSYHAGNLFVIFLYEGNISQSYPKGIIAVDFVNKFNKLMQCSVFCYIVKMCIK